LTLPTAPGVGGDEGAWEFKPTTPNTQQEYEEFVGAGAAETIFEQHGHT